MATPSINLSSHKVEALQARIAALEAALRASEDRTRLLLDSTAQAMEINAQHDLTALLKTVVEKAAGLLGARMGGLYLVRPDGESLELVVSHNLPGDDLSTILNWGEGLSGRVAQTGQALIIPDYRVRAGRAAVYEDHPFRRVIGVPLKVRDRVIGVLNVTDDQRTGFFSADEVQLLTLFADQAAIAVTNVRLYEAARRELLELRQAEQIQSSLYRISEAAHSAQSLDELYQAIHGIVNQLMPARNFFIALYDAASDTISFPYYIDEHFPPGQPVPPRPRGNGLVEYILRTGEPLLGTAEEIAALVQEQNFQPRGPLPLDWLGVPMKVQGKTIGVLAAQTYTEGERLTEAHRDIFMFVSEQVVTAIQRKRAEQVQVSLYQISQAALTAPSLDELYRLIHHIVNELMPARNLYIALYDEGSDLIWYPYLVDEADNTEPVQRLGKGLTSYVLRTGQPLFAPPEVFNDLVAQGEVELIGSPSIDWLGAPLKVDDHTIGVIAVQTYSEHMRLTEEHKDILVFVSSQVAMAIQRRRAEDALRASEARLRLVLSSMPVIMFALDRNGVLLFVEGKGLEALGVGPDLTVERTVLDLFRDNPFLAHTLQRALAGEEFGLVYQVDQQALRVLAALVSQDFKPAHDPMTFEFWFSPLRDTAGNADGVIGVAIDISERIHTEEALRRAQKMESLGILAGGIAHDFNNLLVAMLSQTSLALTKLSPDSAAQTHIEKAVTAAQRAATLTRQLLAYSGKAQFDWRPFNLNALIQENLHLFEVAVPKNVELRSELSAPLPLIEGDPGQVQQVIMNLIINAAEAIGESPGRVNVRTGVCDLADADRPAWRIGDEALTPGRFVLLEVEDNGSGMDAATLSRIFDPFFTTKFTGRGLGLAAVLGIVRGHRGGMQVKSTPRVGTRFQLVFPASALEIVLPQLAEPPQEIDMKQHIVLVIDDEAPVRDAVVDILALENVPVITAPDGRTGIDLYRTHQADIRLVILDLSMPGLSGEATLNELRRINAQVPVLLSSGYSQDEVAQRFAGQAVIGFIQKPYEISALIDEVKRRLAA